MQEIANNTIGRIDLTEVLKMADKTPVLYTEVQEKSIGHYSSQIFGKKEWDFHYHVMNSEYVHSDLIIPPDPGDGEQSVKKGREE